MMPGIYDRILDCLPFGAFYCGNGNENESMVRLYVGKIQFVACCFSALLSVFLSAEEIKTVADKSTELLTQISAVEQLQRRLNEEISTLGDAHPTTQDSRLAFAVQLEKLNRLPEAEHHLQKALGIYLETRKQPGVETMQVEDMLAQVFERQGNYQAAEPLYITLLQQSKSHYGRWHPNTLQATYKLARHYEDAGALESASALYEEAVSGVTKALGAEHVLTIEALENLAQFYLLDQKYAAAAGLLRTVTNHYSANLGPQHEKALRARYQLALAYCQQNDHAAAELQLTELLDIHNEKGGQDLWQTLKIQHDLADVYHRQGRHNESEQLLHKILTASTRLLGDHHPHVLDTLHSLARVSKSRNDQTEELRLRTVAFQRRTEYLKRMLWPAGGATRDGYIRLHKPELDVYLALLARIDDDELAAKRLLEVILSRKGLLLQISSAIEHATSLSLRPEVQNEVRQLAEARKHLATHTLAGPDTQDQKKYLLDMVRMENQIDDLEAVLGRASQRFQRTISNVSLENLESKLPDNSLLVDFLIYSDGGSSHLLAGLMRKEQGKITFHRQVYSDWAAIQTSMGNYREIIQDSDNEPREVQEAGRALYELLWAPLTSFIGNMKTIYLVPDGLLNITPFSALIDPQDRYLVQDHDIYFLSSSRDLLHPVETGSGGEITILAAPDYSARGLTDRAILQQIKLRHPGQFHAGIRAMGPGMLHDLQFEPLPGARREGQVIFSILENHGRSHLNNLNGIQVQERRMRAMSHSAEILHIATHGFFLPPDEVHHKRLLKAQRGGSYHPSPGDNPLLRAGLVFAGANETAALLGEIDIENDGILTAFEILSLDLSGTRIVVLSACDTGLGEIHEGEGVYGLRRAFMEVGAGAIVNSLWEVSDAGTVQLMTTFYEHLATGTPAAEALQMSQRSLIASDVWNTPFIWSAFYLVGR